MNPINAYLGPFFERAFADLIADGYLRIVYGGTDVGDYLSRHSGIDTIHLTGSAATHDAIVFGTGEAGAARKRRDEPINHKPISSELGGVSPTIVVPGPWSRADLRFQAEHIATQKLHNGGFNCIAAQMLVLPEDWSGTPALLDEVRRVLRDAPSRAAYYPGAAQRQQALAAGHTAEWIAKPGDAAPRLFLDGLDAAATDEPSYTDEAFAAVLGATRLPGEDAAEFLHNAVAFCNERLAGTLGANFVVHPTTARELSTALDDAIAALRYGCVAVNAWTGVGFLIAQTPWGAYPGHTRDAVGSGIGVVHNSLMFDRPQKSVVRGPFYPFPRGVVHGQFALLPKPPWFITHRRAASLGRRLVQFEARPGLGHLPGIFAAALRG